MSGGWRTRPDSGGAPLAAMTSMAGLLQSLPLGRPGLFRPRLATDAMPGEAPGLYDLAPLRGHLEELLDFDRLNSGETRLSMAATDEAGAGRVFDFSRATIADRWDAGGRAMRAALSRLEPSPAVVPAPGPMLHEIAD